MLRTLILVGFGALMLGGCASSLPPVHSIDTKAVSAVQAEIKRQVGVYIREANADRAKRNASKPNVNDYWCGSGALDFEINSVKIDLLTSRDTTSKVNVGLKIPISAFTLSPSASHSYEATNIEELVYNEWLVSGGEAPDETFVKSLPGGKEKDAPLARILMDLRTGLIDASKKAQPPAPPNGPQSCFSAYNQIASKAGDDPGNSIKIAFTAISDDNGGVSLDLGIVSLGGSVDSKGTASSTITASFREVGSARLKPCDADKNKNKNKICDSAGVHPGDDHYILRFGPISVLPGASPLSPAPVPQPLPMSNP